jgi:UDP-N-acetyl-D-mannosaminuronate dehydrogenase
VFVADDVVIVVGMGEVGLPLFQILNRKFAALAIDITPVHTDKRCQALHVCYPFQIADFIHTTAQYIHKYRPALTIIHSTVAPGTTRRVWEQAGTGPVIYSPVRGKHARMEVDMLHYKKFVAGFDQSSVDLARYHLTEAGFQTETFRTPEIAELSKLLETTYLGILVAWAQEIERFAARFNAKFEEINAFIKEVPFLPCDIFPGIIGGHCVMPNIAILQSQFKSEFLDAIQASNESKKALTDQKPEAQEALFAP